VTLLALIDAELGRHPRDQNILGDTVCGACEEWQWPCPTHKALSALRVTVEALEVDRENHRRAAHSGCCISCDCMEHPWPCLTSRNAGKALATARKEMEG